MLGGRAAEVDQPAARPQALAPRPRPGRRTAGRAPGRPARRPRRRSRAASSATSSVSRATTTSAPAARARCCPVVRAGRGHDPRGAVQPAPAGRRPARPRRRRRARRRSRPAPARRARSAPCTPRWRTARAPRSRSAPPRRAAAPGRPSATATASAMLPSPGAIPADVGNHTAWPSTVPTPCTPGTYGVRGTPKYDVPEAQSRSSGVIGAAVTRTSTSPAPGVGLVAVDDRGWLARACASSTARIVRPAAARSRRWPTTHGTSLVPPSGVARLVVLVADDQLLLGAEHDVAVEVLRTLLEQVGDQRPEAGHVEQEVHVRRAEVADLGLPDQLADRPVHRDRVALRARWCGGSRCRPRGRCTSPAAGPRRPASCAS